MTDTMPTDVLKLRSPPDILEAVPYLLGFEPRASLVVLSLHGTRNRLGLQMRIDIDVPGTVQENAAVLVGHLARDGARAAILVAYAEPHGTDPDALVAAMRSELRRQRIAVPEALRVAGGRWTSYTCRRRACCPPHGTPVQDRMRRPSRIGAAAVAAGMGVLPSREALAATLAPVGGLLHIEMAAAIDRHSLPFAAVLPTPGRTEYADTTMSLVHAWAARCAAGDDEMPIDAAARMIVGLRDRDVRDRCLPWGQHLTGEPGLGPRAGGLWAELVRRAVLPAFVAPPATLLAWCAYLDDANGVLANIALERALADDREYTMARYLLAVLQRGMPPEQARAMLEGGLGGWPEGGLPVGAQGGLQDRTA